MEKLTDSSSEVIIDKMSSECLLLMQSIFNPLSLYKIDSKIDRGGNRECISAPSLPSEELEHVYQRHSKCLLCHLKICANISANAIFAS